MRGLWRLLVLLALSVILVYFSDWYIHFLVESDLKTIQRRGDLQRNIPERSPEQQIQQKIFNVALVNLDVGAVKVLLASGAVDPNGDPALDEAVPLYRVIAAADKTLSVERHLGILRELLSTPGINPNGDFRSWTPLKKAIAQEFHGAVKLLLSHPETVKEVHSAGLQCKIQSGMTPEVSIIVAPDANSCWTSHPRAIPEESSTLMKLARLQRTGASAATRSPSVEGLTSARPPPPQETYDPRNPFQDPPPGVLPPREALIMNPKAFRNVAEAIGYYFLGVTLGWAHFLGLTLLGAIWAAQVTLMIFALRFASRAAERPVQVDGGAQ